MLRVAMKLGRRMLGDKSVSNQKEGAILSAIENGKLYREDADHTYSFSGDVTDACIDSSRYVDPFEIRLSLSEEITKLLDEKNNIQDQLKVAELDKKNVIVAYLANCQYYTIDNISNLLSSKDEYLSSVGVGLAVIYSNPQLIPSLKLGGLYKYFRSCEISKDELNLFTSNEFIEYSFRKILKEERVIFTWMINNLVSLVNIDAINIEENSEFFVKLLSDNDYPNQTHMSLFLLVLKKRPKFIEDILKLNLHIDPFTKQYNYSKWLKEARKFSFISNLRDSISADYSSKETICFDKRKSELNRINKYDRSLEM